MKIYRPDEVLYYMRHIAATFIDNNLPCIYINMSHRCNMACDFCCVDQFKHYPDITKETLDAILYQAFNKVKVKYNIDLIGGEPTLNPEGCKYVLKTCREHKVMTRLSTNGWWVNEPEFDWLFSEEYKPNYIIVSANKYLPYMNTENIYKLYKKCRKHHIGFLIAMIGITRGDKIEEFCRLHGIYHYHREVMFSDVVPEKTYESDRMIKRTCCAREGINVFSNGDTYFACTLRQCKVGTIDTLGEDLNNVVYYSRRPDRQVFAENIKEGSHVKCTWDMAKIIQDMRAK